MGRVPTAWKNPESPPLSVSCSCCLLSVRFLFCWLFWKDFRSKKPTCCATVFANSEFELLLDRRNLEFVIHGVGSLWTQAQVKPQLILSRSVGKLIYLIQTWGNSQTENVKARSNTLLLFKYAWEQTEHWIAHQSRTPLSRCQNLLCTVSSVSESPACQLYVAGAPERRRSTFHWQLLNKCFKQVALGFLVAFPTTKIPVAITVNFYY